MHPCLRLEELLLKVFQGLDQPALAVLARTCQAFSGPALDLLYESIDLDTVVKCLPEDVWSVRFDPPGPDRPIFFGIVRPV